MTVTAVFTAIKGLLLALGRVVLALFPDSPFATVMEGILVFPNLSWLNWFVPIDQFVAVGEVWLLAVGTYYLYSTIARVSQMLP